MAIGLVRFRLSAVISLGKFNLSSDSLRSVTYASIVFTSRVLSGISCTLLPKEDTMPIQSFSVGLICIMK